jgi:hypothetical protein
VSRRKSKQSGAGILLFLLSLLLIPLAVALLLNFPVLFSGYRRLTPGMIWFMAGFGFFAVVFLLFGPPVKTYVLEHELTHILAAWMTGVRVKRVSLNRNKPYVQTDRVNLFIALIPFALPLYALLLGLAYRLLGRYVPYPFFSATLFFLTGAALCFHLMATVHYLQLEQPDVRRYGTFASLVLVFLWALTVLSLMSALLFERVHLIAYFKRSFSDTWLMYRRLEMVIAGFFG